MKSLTFWRAACCLLMLGGLLTPAFAQTVYVAANLPTGQFGKLDLTTGVFTAIGPLASGSSGMAFGEGAALYNLDAFNVLETINPANAVVSPIGNVGGGTIDFGGNAYSLFGFLLNGLKLDEYTYDPATAVPHFVGTSFTFLAGRAYRIWATSSGSSTPYLVVEEDCDTLGCVLLPSNLYAVDPNTGQANLIGPTGATGAIVGLVMVDGILYGVDQDLKGINAPRIYTLNTSTGAATFVTTVKGGIDAIYGLAPVNGGCSQFASASWWYWYVSCF